MSNSNVNLTRQAQLLNVILKPHVSEKTSLIADKNRQFVFKVAPSANKSDVKSAVEMLFNVQVDAVQLCNVKGKERRFRQRLGTHKGWKKAYVSLKEGFDIDFTGVK